MTRPPCLVSLCKCISGGAPRLWSQWSQHDARHHTHHHRSAPTWALPTNQENTEKKFTFFLYSKEKKASKKERLKENYVLINFLTFELFPVTMRPLSPLPAAATAALLMILGLQDSVSGQEKNILIFIAILTLLFPS